jgi:hypothetical protein
LHSYSILYVEKPQTRKIDNSLRKGRLSMGALEGKRYAVKGRGEGSGKEW